MATITPVIHINSYDNGSNQSTWKLAVKPTPLLSLTPSLDPSLESSGPTLDSFVSSVLRRSWGAGGETVKKIVFSTHDLNILLLPWR